MFYKIGKKLFEIARNSINLTRVSLVFFTFFMVTYWIFEIAQAPFIANFTPFFGAIKDFIHTFYSRGTVVDEVRLDYSFLVLSIILLVICWLLKFVVEFLEKMEEKYENTHKILKGKEEELFNINLEKNYKNIEHKNSNFALIVKFTAQNLSRDTLFDYNTNEGVEEKEKKSLDEFLGKMAESLIFEKKVFANGAILFFHKVKNLDKITSAATRNLDRIREHAKMERWDVSFLSGIETYSSESEVVEKSRKLLLLVKLNLKNELLCLSTYKQRYSLVQDQKFYIESKGTYKIDGEEDVFCIKNKSYLKQL